MKRTRRKFSVSFKAKVAIEAIKERSSLQELASKYELHPNQISSWKREFLDNASLAFDSKPEKEDSTTERRKKVVKRHPRLSLVQQCKLLKIHRSGLYYKPRSESAYNLMLMKEIDAHFLEHPYYGVERMTDYLNLDLGHRNSPTF